MESFPLESGTILLLCQALLLTVGKYLTGEQGIQKESITTGGTTSYGYDTKGQIAGETSTRGLSHNHAFGFDGAGNPTSWRGTARGFDANNQETTGGPLAFSYDGAGNATRWSAKRLVSTPAPPRARPTSWAKSQTVWRWPTARKARWRRSTNFSPTAARAL